jgi:hypothetical protein
MCDIEKERRKIDALIEETVSPFWYADVGNRDALVEFAVRCLRDDYSGFCTDECIRARCEAHVARRVGRFDA